MAQATDMVGEIRGHLTVVARANNNPEGRAMWWCRCKCGKYILALGKYLRNGDVTSCGRCSKVTHGMSGTPQYQAYEDMHQRCYNENCPNYPNYGARGIKVCPEWHTFEGFWADMGEGYKEGLTLERIDRNGDYCPQNCCWATWGVQENNKNNNVFCTINGKTQTLAQHIADPEINIYNLNDGTVRNRKSLGWPDKKIFSTPVEGPPVYTIKGKTQTLAEHLADPEINEHKLKKRTVEARVYVYGQTLEEALSTPVKDNRILIQGKYQTLTQHVADPEINVHNLKRQTVYTRFYTLGWPEDKLFSPLGTIINVSDRKI